MAKTPRQRSTRSKTATKGGTRQRPTLKKKVAATPEAQLTPQAATAVPASRRGLTVLFIGDAARAEFQPTFLRLQQAAAVSLVADVRQACARLTDWTPNLVIVAQSYPGELSPQRLAQLRDVAGSAAIVLAEGPCAAGEGRSGPKFDNLWRIDWHTAPARFAMGLQAVRSGQTPWWELAPDAPVDEPAAATRGGRKATPRAKPVDHEHPRIGVVFSAERECSRLLADLVHEFDLEPLELQRGFGSASDQSLPRLHGVRIALWDLAELPDDADLEAAAARLVESVALAPVLAILQDARPEALAALERGGITGAIARPFDLSLLRWELAQALDAEARSSAIR